MLKDFIIDCHSTKARKCSFILKGNLLVGKILGFGDQTGEFKSWFCQLAPALLKFLRLRKL